MEHMGRPFARRRRAAATRGLTSLSMRVAVIVALLALLVPGAKPAYAADPYPSNVIRIIVPFPPGGLNDNVIRVIQPYLQQKLGQSIIIENKSGASGIIGTDAVAKAKPDGYTLAVVASSHTVTPATNAAMPFDTEHDLAAVSLLVRDPLLFVAGPKSGAKTLAELVALAKASPDKLTYATPGADSQSHFVTELFNERAGIKTLQVPYRGGAPSVLSLIASETDFAVLSTQLSAPQIEAGKLIPLASGGRERSPHYRDVPTLIEAGFPGMEALQWVGMLAPAQTPKDVIATLNAALREVLAMPEVASKLDAQGVTPAASTPEEFQAMITSEVKQWKDVAADTGIKPH
jgi:tripartite-type tricarboxylate transporter receptor subunit TctC